MSLTAVLDIVIGLCFTYFLLSLICSWANEWIAHKLNKRGEHLFDGLREMLQDRNTLEKFVTHPLIESLDRVRGDATRTPIASDPGYEKRKRIFPSYLPANTMATVLLDVISPSGGASRFADARAQIDALPASKLKTALQSIAARADNDIEALRKGVEDWYSSVMDRVSGWYKHNAQWMLILIGLLAAVAFNVDTFRIVRELWDNPIARAALVQAATSAAQQSGAESVKEQLKAIDAAKSPAERKALLEKLNKQLDAPKKFGLVLGTTESSGIPVGWNEDDSNWGGWDFVFKFFGLIVTACAIALGAPFWFELVNKLVDIRGAGKKPEENK